MARHNINTTVRKAIAIKRKIDELSAELENLKHEIRTEARNLGLDEIRTPVDIKTVYGVVSVAHVKDRWKLLDPHAANGLLASQRLPENVWHNIFRLLPALRPGAPEVIKKSLAPQHRSALEEIIEVTVCNARVTLPK